MKFVWIVSLFLLIGCATKPLTKEMSKKVDEIAVVAYLNHQAEMQYKGTTIFQNKKHLISDHSLGKSIESIYKKKLKKSGKRIVSLKIDREALQKFYNSGLPLQYEESRKYFAKKAKQKGAKYLVMVEPLVKTGYIKGYGLMCHSAFGIKGSGPQLHTYYYTSLIDTSSNKLLYRNLVTFKNDFGAKTYNIDCDENYPSKISKSKIKKDLLKLMDAGAQAFLSKSNLSL